MPVPHSTAFAVVLSLGQWIHDQGNFDWDVVAVATGVAVITVVKWLNQYGDIAGNCLPAPVGFEKTVSVVVTLCRNICEYNGKRESSRGELNGDRGGKTYVLVMVNGIDVVEIATVDSVTVLSLLRSQRSCQFHTSW